MTCEICANDPAPCNMCWPDDPKELEQCEWVCDDIIDALPVQSTAVTDQQARAVTRLIMQTRQAVRDTTTDPKLLEHYHSRGDQLLRFRARVRELEIEIDLALGGWNDVKARDRLRKVVSGG